MPSKNTKILICFTLIIVSLVVYWRALGNGFVGYDDPKYIYENEHVSTGISSDNLAWAFSATHASNWHPVTWISHMVDGQIFGLKPFGHHLTNIILHAVNAALLFLLVYALTGALGPAIFVAALFALHPLHVESVAWVSERKDVLSTFFGLLALLVYNRYARRPSAGLYAAVVAFLALGLMSKPMLVTLPCVFLLLDYWPLGRTGFGPEPEIADAGIPKKTTVGLVVEKLPFFALSAASSIITFIAQQTRAMSDLDRLPLDYRVMNALTSYASYLIKTVWPSKMAVFYPYNWNIPAWQWIGSAILLLAITAWVVREWKKAPYLPVGWFWFLGTLVPVIGLVQVGKQAMADRYVYFPHIGLFILIVWAIKAVLEKRKIGKTPVMVVSGVILIVFAGVSWAQIGKWKNSMTLFSHAASVTKGNYLANYNVGNELQRRGDLAGARERYEAALAAKPDYIGAMNNLGHVYLAQKNLENAEKMFNRVIQADPGNTGARMNLGLVCLNRGRLDEALAQYEKVMEIDPNLAMAHHMAGTVLWRRDEIEKALAQFREGLRLNPDDANAQNNMGNALWTINRLEEAIQHFEKALKINPRHKQAAENLARARQALGRQ